MLVLNQAELHRDRIYGAHVAEYMEYLTEEDEAKYKEHFASYIENEITFEDVEEMYKETHKAIRGDPSPAPKAAFTPDKAFKNTVGLVFDASFHWARNTCVVDGGCCFVTCREPLKDREIARFRASFVVAQIEDALSCLMLLR